VFDYYIDLYYIVIHVIQGDTKMSAALSVRLPDKLARELEQISKETERSKSFHIQKAIEMYIAECADMQIAFDRLNDPTDTVITMDDMRSKLGV
jgi:RHH-type rel operon transcriptional repressor/antitoxin RelB